MPRRKHTKLISVITKGPIKVESYVIINRTFLTDNFIQNTEKGVKIFNDVLISLYSK